MRIATLFGIVLLSSLLSPAVFPQVATSPASPAAPSQISDINAIMKQGTDAFNSGDYALALALFRTVIASAPSNINAQNMAANCSLQLKDFPAAIESFKRALELQPNETHNLAGLMRAYTLAGMTKERDEERQHIQLLSSRGYLPPSFQYVFDTFQAGGMNIEVAEYPQLSPEKFHYRYLFNAYDAQGKMAYEVALESDEFDQIFWSKNHHQQAEAGDREFSLDGYRSNGTSRSQEVYQFFDGEPPYEQVRDRVQQIIAGSIHAMASTSLQPAPTSAPTSPAGPPSNPSPTASAPNPVTSQPKPDSSPGVTERYKPALGSSPSPNDMDTIVTKSDLGDHVQLLISLKAPKASSVVRAPFDLIKVYGSQKTGPPGSRPNNLPVSAFPYFHGNWNPGDHITISVDVPKQYSDPTQGWNLTFCIGATNGGCMPSPNLLEGKRIR